MLEVPIPFFNSGTGIEISKEMLEKNPTLVDFLSATSTDVSCDRNATLVGSAPLKSICNANFSTSFNFINDLVTDVRAVNCVTGTCLSSAYVKTPAPPGFVFYQGA
jgi:hypothetical protein